MNQTPENTYSANILIVDDIAANLGVLSKMVSQQGYTPRPVPNGKLALKAIEIEPPDLILLDISMPDMNGYEVCQAIKANERLKDIPIIFISSLTETFDKVMAFSVGGIDYITKPFQIDEVYARINTQLKVRHLQLELEKTILHLEERVQEQVKEISDSQNATIFALARLSESRDDETGKHLERVRSFCKLLTERLAKSSEYAQQIPGSFIENIYHASPLHDIGKVGIPDSILLKPGKLTAEEFEVMKRHTLIGAQTLRAVVDQYPQNPMILMGIEIARSHHERWDGGGYPNGLAGQNIPLAARIMSLADIYDALRSKRVYKPAYSHEETMQMILKSCGTQLDPQIVAAFQDLQGEFFSVYNQLVDQYDNLTT
jgi:putative two-component system response regulator